MLRYFVLWWMLVVAFGFRLSAQELYKVKGTIKDSLSQPVSHAQVVVMPDSILTSSDDNGVFTLDLGPGMHSISIFHLQFDAYSSSIRVSEDVDLDIDLFFRTEYLNDVKVMGRTYEPSISNIRLDSKNIYNLPTATGDFTKILSTLPGVSSNNELSSVYSVRGGNYDENLVYVNGIKIYRPQIISAGRQEGLSFVNPDMVGAINFSAGAWEASLGDKLSSVLSVEYREPTHQEATLNLSLLGGSVYIGGLSKDQSLTYTLSARHKNTRYLLGTLETDGEYLPRFTDIQTFINKKFANGKTELAFLYASAINNYETIPSSQETDFGDFQSSFRLKVFFDGRELLDYYTNQGALMIKHQFNERFRSVLSLSGVLSSERENYEIEGAYRLCDVDKDLSSLGFNDCINELGAGTNYSYGRNRLEAEVFSLSQRNEVEVGNHLLEFGVDWDIESIDDRLDEFEFVDSLDFVTITEALDNEFSISSQKLSGFVQMQLTSIDKSHYLNFGVRSSYWSYSNQILISPRLQYSYTFGFDQRNTISAAVGHYAQHPFYRELRNRDGEINPDIKAQESMHALVGWDHHFFLWGRPFMFSSEAYYKRMWNVNPYDVENVKIRYFANNLAKAYAYGVDFRLNGEFIAGTESWFSLGILKTEEDIGQGYGYVRRPMDQRINLGVFFQDHLPNDPSVKVNLNVQLGSGLPFGPPNDDANRSAFEGDLYTRIDLGFSKNFNFESQKIWIPESFWIGLDVLNILGTDNVLTYTWITDVSNNQYAIPNALTARFFNLRMIAKF